MKIQIRTKFDCTLTGTTGHYKSNKVPYKDQQENNITDYATWIRSRNQQRNYETILQIVGLRTQLIEVSIPVVDNGIWSWYIVPDRDDVFTDEFESLKSDCQNVPMIIDLGEQDNLPPVLCINGESSNIWFDRIE